MMRVTFQKAFSLHELLVTLAIIAIISTVVIANQGDFRDNIETSNLAHEVALTIREAQLLANSVRQFGGVDATGYGVRFDNADLSKFILFVDRSTAGPADQIYTPAHDDTVQTFSLRRGNTFSDFCGLNDGHPDTCLESVAPAHQINSLDIFFERPQFDATVIATGCTSCNAPWENGALIKIRSLKGITREVRITNTGQISVP